MKKEFKIEGIEQALKGIPEEDRANVEAEIRGIFANFDPKNPPGKPVVRVPPGTRVCPQCQGVLEGDHVAHGLRFLNCNGCDAPYAEQVDA